MENCKHNDLEFLYDVLAEGKMIDISICMECGDTVVEDKKYLPAPPEEIILNLN